MCGEVTMAYFSLVPSIKLKILNVIKTVCKKIFRINISWANKSDPTDVITSLLDNDEQLVIVDGGAFHGHFTKALYRKLSRSRFLLFEPSPKSFQRLLRNFHNNPALICENLAIGAASGLAQLHLNKSSLTNSLKFTSNTSKIYHGDLCQTIDTCEVGVCSLDQYFSQSDLSYPDIIKLDLQGGELDAINGGTRCLSHARIVLCEVQFVKLYDGSALFSELNAKLEALGFQLFQIFDLASDRSSGRLLFCDALYVRPNLLDDRQHG